MHHLICNVTHLNFKKRCNKFVLLIVLLSTKPFVSFLVNFRKLYLCKFLSSQFKYFYILVIVAFQMVLFKIKIAYITY